MGLKISKPSLFPPKKKKSNPISLLPPEEINSKPSLLFPEDIIEDILSRLPAKSLLKFRCVSKSWRSLIESERFIKTHHQNSYPHGIKYISNHASRLKQCSVMADPYAELPINDPINNHLTKGRVAGCCNGLLCILKKGRFFLWNPATRISVKLPKINNVIHKYGLGWDERSDAYKLFAVVSNRNRRIGKVYSSKTNSWKTVEHGCCGPALYNRAGVFAGGKIYWINGSRDGIESFDLESEEFGRIDLPCKLGGGWPWLTEIGERLELWVSKGTLLNMWILKEESWVWFTKNQNHFPLKYTSQGYFYIESLVSPLAILT